jgi:hypothetical protein
LRRLAATAALALLGCASGPGGTPQDSAPIEAVLVFRGELPERIEVIDHASTGRSVATAIGSAVPFAGLFADAAARGVAERGAEGREEALRKKLGGYGPDEAFLAALEEALGARGLRLTVSDEERRPLPGEAVLRVSARAFGLARTDKESAYAPEARVRLSLFGLAGQQSSFLSCEKGRGQEMLSCPPIRFGGMDDMLARPDAVRRMGDAMAEGLAEAAADLADRQTQSNTTLR